MVFTGDALFAGSVGRVDLMSEERAANAAALFDSLHGQTPLAPRWHGGLPGSRGGFGLRGRDPRPAALDDRARASDEPGPRDGPRAVHRRKGRRADLPGPVLPADGGAEPGGPAGAARRNTAPAARPGRARRDAGRRHPVADRVRRRARAGQPQHLARGTGGLHGLGPRLRPPDRARRRLRPRSRPGRCPLRPARVRQPCRLSRRRLRVLVPYGPTGRPSPRLDRLRPPRPPRRGHGPRCPGRQPPHRAGGDPRVAPHLCRRTRVPARRDPARPDDRDPLRRRVQGKPRGEPARARTDSTQSRTCSAASPPGRVPGSPSWRRHESLCRNGCCFTPADGSRRRRIRRRDGHGLPDNARRARAGQRRPPDGHHREQRRVAPRREFVDRRSGGRVRAPALVGPDRPLRRIPGDRLTRARSGRPAQFPCPRTVRSRDLLPRGLDQDRAGPDRPLPARRERRHAGRPASPSPRSRSRSLYPTPSRPGTPSLSTSLWSTTGAPQRPTYC